MNKFTSENENLSLQLHFMSLLDFCKGLAIAWIFLFHYKYRLFKFGWQGVHVFIVLSGLGLTYSCLTRNGKISWMQWYSKRFEKLLPTYWLVAIVGFIVMVFVNIIINNHASSASATLEPAIKLVLNILLLRNFSYRNITASPNGALWFIPFIVGFYLVFPLLYSHFLSYKKIRNKL